MTLENAIAALEEECPLGWECQTRSPGLLDFRSESLASPHGLSVHVEYLSHLASCSIQLDAFAGPLAATIRSSFESFRLGKVARPSASGWEGRVGVQVRDSQDSVGLFVSRDVAGTTVGRDPIQVLDVLSAAGRVIADALEVQPTGALRESDDTTETGLPEGAITEVHVNRYERDPRNRARAIQIHGSDCAACGLNFGRQYGPLAHGYIHIHHIVPVSQIGPNYVIDPEKDLIPLCPNCHAAAHRRNPPLTLSELKASLRDCSS